MSDSEGDVYHEEGFPSLHSAEGSVDSLPDIVLSSTSLSQTTQVRHSWQLLLNLRLIEIYILSLYMKVLSMYEDVG